MQRHWSQVALMVSIAVTLVLVLGFVGESMGLFGGGGGGGGSNKSIPLLCLNPDCGKDYEITAKELKEMMGGGGLGMMAIMEQPRFECEFCGEEEACIAEKCEECGTVFIAEFSPNMEGYPDVCPECGYSRMEEMEKKR